MARGESAPTILICHSDAAECGALSRALAPLGRIECADSLAQAVEMLAFGATDCFIVDVPGDRHGMRTLGRITTAYPEMHVAVLAETLPFDAARELVRMGVKDVLPLPLDPSGCEEAVRALLSDRDAGPPGLRGMVVVVTSGKGGTGCTAITVNLAAALAAHGTVVVLDADAPPFGAVAAASDLDGGLSVAGLSRQRLPIDPRVLRRATVPHPAGFSTLALWSAPGEVPEIESAVTGALEALTAMVPLTVVDLGRPVLASQRLLLRRAAVVVAVATLDLLALRNHRQLVDLVAAETGGSARLFSVLNRCDRGESYSVDQAGAALGAPFAAVLPYAPGLTHRLDRGELLVSEEPAGAWSAEVRRLAGAIVDRRRDEARSAFG